MYAPIVGRTHADGCPPVDPDSDDLNAWIADLRVRIACGELAALPQVDLGNGTRVNADLVAQIMLGELDSLDGLPCEEQDQLDQVVKRRSLLWDLIWLRQQIE